MVNHGYSEISRKTVKKHQWKSSYVVKQQTLIMYINSSTWSVPQCNNWFQLVCSGLSVSNLARFASVNWNKALVLCDYEFHVLGFQEQIHAVQGFSREEVWWVYIWQAYFVKFSIV